MKSGTMSMWRVVVCGLAVAMICGVASAEQMVLQDGLDGYAGTEDVHMIRGYGGQSFGGYAEMLVQYDAEYSGYATLLIRFDLSALPADQTIQSATLALYQSDLSNGPDTGPISIYRMKRGWVEGNGMKEYNTGASWTTYDQYGHKWTDRTEGGKGALGSGDREMTATDTFTGSEDTWWEWDVTADVQAHYDGSASNYGWVMDGHDYHPGMWFISRNNTDNESLRPKLTIEYVPEPATIGLLAIGGLLSLIRRRSA